MNNRRIYFFLVAMILIIICLYFIWSPGGLLNINSEDDIANVAVEFHGMVFDIFLFGIVLTIFEYLVDRKDTKTRYQEEMEDFRGWDEKEAAYRLSGILKRLNKLKVYKLNLEDLYLEDAKLKKINLNESKLKQTNLKKSNLQGSKFDKAKIEQSNFNNADMYCCSLTNCSIIDSSFVNVRFGRTWFYRSFFKNCSFIRCNAREGQFNGAKFYNCDLSESYLQHSDFSGSIFENSKFINSDLRYAFSDILRKNEFHFQKKEAKNLVFESFLKFKFPHWKNYFNYQYWRALGRAFFGNNELPEFILADMKNSDFSNADLSWTKLLAMDFSDSNLKNVSFFAANLSFSNLSNCNLEGADLTRANFSNADLTGTLLSEKQLKSIESLKKCEGLTPSTLLYLRRENLAAIK